MVLKLYIKDSELEELFRFFDFGVYFHDLFILKVLFLELSHINLGVHRTDTSNQSEVFFLNTVTVHDFLS